MIKKDQNSQSTDAVREQALLILFKVFEKKSFSNILIKNIGSKFTPLDRAFISEIVYGTIKYKLRLDYIISKLSSIKMSRISPYIMNILRMGFYQIMFMDRVPDSAAVDECVKLAKKYGNIGASKFVNGMLRNYIRNQDSIVYPENKTDPIAYLSVFYSYPEWIVRLLINDYGYDFTEQFLIFENKAPSINVRINSLKTDKESVRNSLLKDGVDVFDGEYTEDSLTLKGVPGIENLEEFNDGLITVQDESSMLAALILSPKPGDFVMDVCSAPGTKSTYIAELMGNNGSIISGDISREKLKLVLQNAKRLGIDIIKTVCQDASTTDGEYISKADRVLVDAPCSGLGIMRKKPEIRWNREPSDIKELSALQKSILLASSKYVQIGGVLVYSTCTVVKEENINVINNFVKENGDFIMDDISDLVPDKLKRESCRKGYLELFPNIDKTDGFFIARMKRVK